MAINQGYDVKIDDKHYKLQGRALLVPRTIFPPRIQTESDRSFESLEEWESWGMKSFIGGMGQKRFGVNGDKEMYYDSFGIDVSLDNEAKLARSIEQVKSVAELGITLADMGGSLSIPIMQIYNKKLYFGAAEGDWGSNCGGRIRIWSWDGTTLTDLKCTRGYSTLAAPVTGGEGPDNTITVADGSQFTNGCYIYINAAAAPDFELMKITNIEANVLTVDRAQSITWDAGKTSPTTAHDFASGLPVFELMPSPYNTIPIKAGDGVSSMAVLDDKLYVGTFTGFCYMFNGTGWYLQPPSANTVCYNGVTRLEGTTSHQISSMFPYKDVLVCWFSDRLEKYDPATPDLNNPWSGTLHTVKDSNTMNNQVLFGTAIYCVSWSDASGSSTLYKYDGDEVYPMYRFPSRFESHSMMVYDGKIFISGGKYNADRTASVGQLYSYDGLTMRKIFSKPRDDEFESGRLHTFYKLMSWDDKLFFSDNYTTGLFVYDAEYDAIHRAFNISTLTGASGNVVRGIHQYKDRYYLAITSNGLYRVKLPGNYDTGGAGRCYGDFLYPYIQTSMFGGDFPSLQKLFYGIRLWHSPIVSGQKFHLHFSRNQGATWSAAHTLTPTTGSTFTEYIFLEEGWADGTGGFNGTPTGEYGFEATDLTLIIAMQSSAATQQFTLQGFTVFYLPLPQHQQRLRMTIIATDNVEVDRQREHENWGIETMQELEAIYKEHRPVVVEHPFEDRGVQKIMLMTDFAAGAPTKRLYEMVGPQTDYALEGLVTVEFAEVGEV